MEEDIYKRTGRYLIDKIVERLKYEGQGHNLYDSTILAKIATLKESELRQIMDLGYVAKWHNEEIVSEQP